MGFSPLTALYIFLLLTFSKKNHPLLEVKIWTHSIVFCVRIISTYHTYFCLVLKPPLSYSPKASCSAQRQLFSGISRLSASMPLNPFVLMFKGSTTGNRIIFGLFASGQRWACGLTTSDERHKLRIDTNLSEPTRPRSSGQHVHRQLAARKSPRLNPLYMGFTWL